MADRKEYFQKYYQEHKEQYARNQREWRKRNPDKVKQTNHEQYIKRKEKKEQEQSRDEALR